MAVNFKVNESIDKLRGGYYTPEPIAKFLIKWVLNANPKTILEPSCGDGAFIKAFTTKPSRAVTLTGVELLESEAVKARKCTKENKFVKGKILSSNFLEWSLVELDKESQFDAIVGNPPYIRYQYLEQQDQKLAEQIFSRYGLAFTKHTNAWVPFVIASIGLLAPGGRLAMVVPSELLHVLHASSLRMFMLSECSRSLMIDPNELLFETALQGTVLLLLEKKITKSQSADGVAIVAAPNNDFLNEDPEKIFNHATYVKPAQLNGKWMKVLLEPEELKVFEKVCKLPSIKRFCEIADVDVGIVTGANNFFLVDNATVHKYKLQAFAKPMFGRSEHCPGIIYSPKTHKHNVTRGMPTNFLSFDKTEFDELPAGAKRYIKEGEKQALHTRYKCRIRKPWYSVPSVYKTKLGMLKRSHNYPRLILNSAEAYTTDTAYRINTSLKPEVLVYCFINSLTALTAEIEGRHYGGGVLELVPSEIEKLLVPIVAIKKMSLSELDAEISAAHDPETLFRKQDKKVLKAAGLNDYECEVIHKALLRIRSRRHRLLGTANNNDQDSSN